MIANRFNSIFNNAYFIPYNSTFATVKAHFRRYLGRKEYELTDHLGNVMVALSDRKLAIPLSSPDVGVQNYLADIKSAQDYYPFGMQMPSRTFSSDKYRFGFNGKENDNEVKGTGSQQDYGMRIYDPRLVRFLSIDPITKKYPELTPYQFASNTPIWGIDLDGLEVRLYTETTQLGHTFLTVGKGKDLIVYTYGRYLGGNKGKSSSASSDPSGRGVLIRMTGTEAKRYLKHELKEYNAKAFEVKGANEQKTKEYYDKIFNSAPKLKESEVTEFEDKNIYGTPNQARVIDTYKLLGNNCTTKVIEAVNQSIKNADNKIPDVKGPMALQEALETESKVNPSQIKDVTKEVQKDVENISSGAGKSW